MKIVNRTLALTCAAAVVAATAPGAAASAQSSPSTGSSFADAAAVLSSGAAPSSLPALTGAELAEGILGSSMFGGLPSVTGSALSSGPGSSNAELTLGDPNLGDVRLVATRHVEGELYEIDVYSPSMDKVITNDLLLPGGPANTAPRPTFYLMMGADGARDNDWAKATDYEEFFLGKNVNVVSPHGSKSSMQADWYYSDPNLGVNRWATYMTYELPHIMDTAFYGSGRDAIAGISMSGGPALNLAAHSPERFVAAGSYSGCPSTLGIGGFMFTSGALDWYDGSSAAMWGLPGNEAWAANSPALNVDKLRDTAVFVSAATGIAGAIDGRQEAGSSGLQPPNSAELGSFICSAYFVDQANRAGVDVDWDPLNEGSHSWGLFEHELRTSWRTIGPAIGA